MPTRNERRSGKPAKLEGAPKSGPQKMKPTAASMQGSKRASSNKRGKR